LTTFPDGFLWGVATAAYQIEGAVDVDGRGPSIWDTFSHEPGRIRNGDNGDVADDHYNRVDQDLELIARLEIPAYRFSISWPRVQPGGKGAVNAKGVDFYRRLLEGLTSRGIEPMVTLYHWDLPQALEDDGGWLDRDTAARFADYAALMVDELGDYAQRWITLNEPWCSAFLGYYEGRFAPGHWSYGEAYTALHHLLLAHGLGLAAIRAGAPELQVGITCNHADILPASEADEDAARAADMEENRLFLDPIFRGEYPADAPDLLREQALVRPGDLDAISAPIDFYGVNYYVREVIAADPGEPHRGWKRVRPHGGDLTAKGDAISPGGLTNVLQRVGLEYANGVPLYITESGAPFDDAIDADGRVDDPRRIDYLADHFRAAHAAMEAGVDLRGYFVWSLFDNFEWDSGYSIRFGIVYVDYATQRRIPKSSALWYREAIRANGIPGRAQDARAPAAID
jgi:beta-glucosidase